MILMTHFYYGDPSEKFSLDLARTLVKSGVDVLEIGIPYSDPVCDGEVFLNACKRALTGGINPLKVFKGIERIRTFFNGKIYLTSYYGPIFKLGLEKCIALAKHAGVTGFIIPDLLLSEQKSLRKLCTKNDLSIIQFATVYSTNERLETICRNSSDFIYAISLAGITGDSKSNPDHVKNLIRCIKSYTDKPVCVGFGIKNAHDVSRVASFGADGVIVGSAIARIYEQAFLMNKNPHESLSEIFDFVNSLKNSTIQRSNYEST